jgi:glycosyltransferase involved in cell wall biosynthesis
MTVCFFGTYDRGHSANRLVARAVEAGGATLEELHEPLWERQANKDRHYFGAASLAGLAWRYARTARELARRWRARRGAPPVVLVGFGGQLDVLLAHRICRPRAALVFAPLVSLTETLVEDRRVFRDGGLPARALARLDRVTLSLPDLVLADTAAHADYLAGLGVPRERVAVWYLGAEPEFLPAQPARETGNRVLYYGRFLPLHGLDTVVEAAARLGSRAEFVAIGDGPERLPMERHAQALGARITWRPPIPLAELPQELARAAVVLGVFGTSHKAAMVVPNKVYQAAAVGRPLVTRDGPGLREVLEPDTHCLACPPGDAAALATAVERLLEDPALGARLGRAARGRILEHLGPAVQGARLCALLAARGSGGAGDAQRRSHG